MHSKVSKETGISSKLTTPPIATLEYLTAVFMIQLTWHGLALRVKSLPKTQALLALIGQANSVLS